jgi:hypothetical protein
VTVTFVGLPLSAPLFKASEGLFATFAVACALLFFLIVLWVVRVLFHAIKTGQLLMRGGYTDRVENPKLYRIYYCFLVFIATILAAMGIFLISAMVFR